MLHEPPFGDLFGAERPDEFGQPGHEATYQPASYYAGQYAPDMADPFDLRDPRDSRDHEPTEEPAELRRRIEDAAHAANELQAALFDLEAELLRLQHIVRRASPAMMQLMQAATEVNAAGLNERR